MTEQKLVVNWIYNMKNTNIIAKQPPRIPVGTRVCDKFNSSTVGSISSEFFEIHGQGMYALHLDKGRWTDDRELYVSDIIIHESCVRTLDQ